MEGCMMKILKSFLAGVLALTMAVTALPQISFADATQDTSTSLRLSSATAIDNSTGGRLSTDITLTVCAEDVSTTDEILSKYAKEDTSLTLRGSNTYTTKWEKYCTYYYYNQMSADEREYYDALNELAAHYMNKKADFELNDDGYYYMDVVDSNDLSVSEEASVYVAFLFSNPQYYFFMTSALVTVSYQDDNGNTQNAVTCMVYNSFVDGSSRTAYTSQFVKQINAMVSQVKGVSSESDKVRAIHDLIENKVSYNYDALNAFTDAALLRKENAYYTQSAYSVMCSSKTVCAGYSLAFCLLCNACGIDAICETSEDHAWNRVNVNDNWYMMDLTWDDGEVITYEFYGRSYSYFINEVDVGIYAGIHTAEAYWDNFTMPSCTLDTNPSDPYTSPGTFVTSSQQTATPTITCKKSGNKYKITITCSTPGTVIYYTTDGTTPYEASGKSYRYTGTFTVKAGGVFSAIAVADGYSDSAVATVTKYGKGDRATVDKIKYKVTNASEKTVTVTGTSIQSGTVTIPAKVTINGITYKVTAVSAKAFKGKTKITKVVIGKNVKKIGKNAFYGCKKLKTIEIKGAKKLSTIGENAFKNISSSATIAVKTSKAKLVKKVKKLVKASGATDLKVKKA